MACSFKPGKGSLQDGLRRVARDQIETALDKIADGDLPFAVRVHQVRKRCKKLHGLIRILRSGLKAYPEENAPFRESARGRPTERWPVMRIKFRQAGLAKPLHTQPMRCPRARRLTDYWQAAA